MEENDFFNTPILFITFNRMDTTIKVFQKIREQKPKKLYLASDGAREAKVGESKKVEEIRNYLIKSIDWECEVKTLFQPKNLGCKFGTHNAITWLFENEERGIIIEDDCLPSNSFFSYCETLLKRYKNDQRIFTISGFNYASDLVNSRESYFFAKFPMIWGWATWRDRWHANLQVIENFEEIQNTQLVNSVTHDHAVSRMIIDNVKLSIENKVDVWDYIWVYTNFINNAVSTVPAKNLVENIGYGPEATHTVGVANDQLIPAVEMQCDCTAPSVILPQNSYDNHLYKDLYNWKSFPEKIADPTHFFKVLKSRILVKLF